MNNTKSILLVAIITATLVMGTSVIPMQSYADRGDDDEDKKGKDHTSQEEKNDANLKLDQENTCYRGEVCKQGNEGQQVVGNDNDVTGFNDQSDNLPTNLPGTGTDNGNETGPVVTPPPANGECSSGEVSVTLTTSASVASQRLHLIKSSWSAPITTHTSWWRVLWKLSSCRFNYRQQSINQSLHLSKVITQVKYSFIFLPS